MSQETQYLAKNVLALRRARNNVFDSKCFAPDGWDVLLALHAANAGFGTPQLLGIGAGAAPTLKRWMGALETEGLIQFAGHGAQMTPQLTSRSEAAISALLEATVLHPTLAAAGIL